MIASICGNQATPLGLAAHPDQDTACVRRALEEGINFFFFYDASHREFAESLKPLLRERREEIIVASGTGARSPRGLRAARERICNVLETDVIDVFFAEYVNPDDKPDLIFGDGGALDELDRWKRNGWIRSVGASAHNRQLAQRLAADPRVDVLMHRFNMAHRKAAVEVFPAALEAQTPVVAFTATRWGTLLEPQPDWSGAQPGAGDCYRYCLAQSAVHLVLTAPQSVEELTENLAALELPAMSERECCEWDRFGDVVYAVRRDADPFEARWP